MKAVLRALLLLLLVGAIVAGGLAYTMAGQGFSTRVPPSAVEERLALLMRRLATPSAVRDVPNPVAPSPEVLDDALAHFADHCASCHANDGSGATPMGSSFYPPSPDMRAARTQELTDGELFTIIEHGIRLTGMPAWGDGTPEGAEGSWGLVHFIRRLPSLSEDEIARMEGLNPKSPAAFREEEETRRFLAGEDESPAPTAAPSHQQAHD